jgi:hypothetical protein
MRKQLTFIVLASAMLFSLNAQQTDINGTTSTSFVSASGDALPLWFYARQEGRMHGQINNQLLTTAKTEFYYSPHRRWQFNAALELDYNSGFDNMYMHTGYVKATWRELELAIGRHTFNPIHEERYSGQGSYLFGDNYRPIDRITVGIPEYTKLFFPYGRIEIRGGISHGLLNDDLGAYKHEKTILHEKFAYLRLDLGHWMPYAGLNHSALIGGHYSNGTKIPVDYWKSFLAKGSEKLGGGEATNAAGAHMGLYDFGIYYSGSQGHVKFYYQKPFADGSGMRIFSRNHDHVVGINWSQANKKSINNITLEWIKTSWQSGEGVPDPIVIMPNGNQRYYTVDQLRNSDLDQLMADLGHIRNETYTLDEVLTFIQNEFNHGHQFGGRDGYMSNGTYPSGWTHHGMTMGSPLNLTYLQLAHIHENIHPNKGTLFVNDRFEALHIGVNGNFNEALQWNAMLTFSVNYGSYYQQYPSPSRYTWDETENYFFSQGLNQINSMLAIIWTPPKLKHLSFESAFAYDTGELFETYGIKIGILWKF